jgi:hypothetical protein
MNKLKTIYTKTMPIITLYSTLVGINIGASVNSQPLNNDPFTKYSQLISYTGLGFITGITFPISYPAFGIYVLYNNNNNNNNDNNNNE